MAAPVGLASHVTGGRPPRANSGLPGTLSTVENLGLVGLSDAGSNRLFSALTGLPDPGVFESAVAIAPVPDERVDRLAAMSHSKKIVHAGFEPVHHLELHAVATPSEDDWAYRVGRAARFG